MPPSAEWGAMMSSGRIFLTNCSMDDFSSCCCYFSHQYYYLILFADVLNDKLDPKQLS